ncbi:hypothetical protein GIW60_29370 [Pseudomonas gessardii]|uniref:hypothetical protein n=1 Tax=Pseudomonas gessardii TaxID=78544 RepID=UPI001F251791|nr:hypothetical protein [Pseudomonas gessardii]MCF4993485.1 hypothetical protein [Pseudomonas gessardii]
MENLFTKPGTERSQADKAIIALGLISALLILWTTLTHQGSWPSYGDMVAGFPAPIASLFLLYKTPRTRDSVVHLVRRLLLEKKKMR